MGEKRAKGVSDSKTRGTPSKKKDALGEREAGDRKIWILSRSFIGLRRNSGEHCLAVARKTTEIGVKTKNGSLLFNMAAFLSMCYTIDKIKT